jgi:transcriptional regulator with XRE-family HTH domain
MTTTTTTTELQDRLRRAREAAGLSRREMAELVPGMTPNRYFSVERGGGPRDREVPALEEALRLLEGGALGGVPADGGEEAPGLAPYAGGDESIDSPHFLDLLRHLDPCRVAGLPGRFRFGRHYRGPKGEHVEVYGGEKFDPDRANHEGIGAGKWFAAVRCVDPARLRDPRGRRLR